MVPEKILRKTSQWETINSNHFQSPLQIPHCLHLYIQRRIVRKQELLVVRYPLALKKEITISISLIKRHQISTREKPLLIRINLWHLLKMLSDGQPSLMMIISLSLMAFWDKMLTMISPLLWTFLARAKISQKLKEENKINQWDFSPLLLWRLYPRQNCLMSQAPRKFLKSMSNKRVHPKWPQYLKVVKELQESQ